MHLTSDLVGRRVTIRFHDGDGAQDVVGRVVQVDAAVTLERRDGSLVVVPVERIIVGKVVPDRPTRSRRAAAIGADDLQRVTARGWPAVESVALGQWLLRAAGGFTGRANSALVAGDPGTDWDTAVGRVVQFYRERGLPALAQVVCSSAEEAGLTDRGWVPAGNTHGGALVQVADLTRPPVADPDVVLADSPDDAWLGLYGRVTQDRLDAARTVLTGPPTVGFLSIGDPVVAIGRVAVTGEWAGVAAVEVLPAHRRTGLATRVVATALAWGLDRGADKAYVQVTPGNTAALALYSRFGFADHHEYRYLLAPG